MISGKERYVVFGVGVALGLVLISFIHQRRAAADPTGDSMMKKVFRDSITSAGVENLPEGTHPSLRQSRLFSLDRLPSPQSRTLRTVWMLEMLEGPWPWVRVERITPLAAEDATAIAPEVNVALADRLLVQLQPGRTPEELDNLLAPMQLTRMQYYRASDSHVIHFDRLGPMALPALLNQLQEQHDLIASASPHPATYY